MNRNMADNKDYSKLPLEELLAEEKKIKKNEITSAVLIGIAIGIMVYGIATKGIGFLYIFIPLLLIGGIYKNSQKQKHNLKQIQAEINVKNTKQ